MWSRNNWTEYQYGDVDETTNQASCPVELPAGTQQHLPLVLSGQFGRPDSKDPLFSSATYPKKDRIVVLRTMVFLQFWVEYLAITQEEDHSVLPQVRWAIAKLDEGGVWETTFIQTSLFQSGFMQDERILQCGILKWSFESSAFDTALSGWFKPRGNALLEVDIKPRTRLETGEGLFLVLENGKCTMHDILFDRDMSYNGFSRSLFRE